MNEQQTVEKIRKGLEKNGIFSSKEQAKEELELYQDYQLTVMSDIIHRGDGTMTQTLALIEKTIDILQEFIDSPGQNSRKRKRSDLIN